MGTHCYIGVEDEVDGNVTFSYCHYDGYPDGVGKDLVELDRDEAMVHACFGDMRALGESINNPDTCHEVRDVNEYEEEIENGPVEYAYLLGHHGEWQVYIKHGPESGTWLDLREVLHLVPKAQARVQPASEPGYSGSTGGDNNMRTNEVIGFRVVNVEHEFFVDTDANGSNFTTDEEPKPIARGDAFRRLAAFLDANPGESHEDYSVEAVYRETTPIENAANELGGLFEQLCQRHGLDLGLDRSQINALLAKDLEAVKNLGFISGIPGFRK